MIYIYSLTGCPFSKAAEKLARDIRVPHKIIRVNTPKDKDKYKKQHKMDTFPQIFFKNSREQMVKIGGFNDFKNIVEFCRKI